jgi:glycosyltransferase involved in cell wall biosynthesis
MTPSPPLRIAILWKQLSGYWIACFRALAAEGVSVHVVHRAAHPDAPYSDASLAGAFPGHCWDAEPDEPRIGREMAAFAPDALLVASWDVGAYRHVARTMKGRTLRILGMDNQWLGTPKQWGGSLISRLAIRPCYDVAFVPGERQATFARRLGFGDDRILWGFYTCDYPAFAAAAAGEAAAAVGVGVGGEPGAGDEPGAGAEGGLRRPAFVFAGRLSSEKGLDVLVEAYRSYRGQRRDPWTLVVCGTGPLAASLDQVEGIDARGFVQPGDLPSVFARASCLVLPSTFEPWGVVVHEAAAAGLAIICSTAVGASSRFVVDGYNGALVPPGDPASLAGALDVMSGPATPLAAFSRRSSELARQFTPERWARYLVDQIVRRRALGHGSGQP